MKYTNISIDTLTAGMRYTEPLLNRRKSILLPAYHSIHPLYIEEWEKSREFITTTGELYNTTEKSSYDLELPGYMDLEIRRLIQKYYNTVEQFKQLLLDINKIDMSKVQSIVYPWVFYAMQHSGSTDLLKICRYALFDHDEYFYYHSVDMMLLSLSIQQYYQSINMTELMKVAVGALLCDIGMFLLPLNLKNIDTNYDEEQKKEISKHTLLGYGFLIKRLAFPHIYSAPALEHHERPDGSGYPRGITGHHISHNSIIISLADVFTSQIRARTYREGREPAEILKDFVQTMMPIFSKEYDLYISAFVSFVTIYPVTSVLKLNTGEMAIVTQTYLTSPMRPKVMLLFDKSEQQYVKKQEIDLKEQENDDIFITGIYTREMLAEFKYN